MLKLIIFDLDGTLSDTSRDIRKSLNLSLAMHGLPEISLEKTLCFVGDGAYKLVVRAVDYLCKTADAAERESIVKRVYTDFSRIYAASDNALTTLYDGESGFLKGCERAEIKLSVLSNKPQAAVDGVRRDVLGGFKFDCVLGQSDKFPLKPDPASTLYLLERAGVSREECLFVGDGEADIATAKNAGIASVSCLWGFRTREKLDEAGAENFAESFVGLAEIILKKFGNFIEIDSRL